MDNITQRLLKIISKTLNIPENKIHLNSTMKSHGMDSLDGVELIMSIEEEFGFEILDKEADKLKTFKDCIDLIKRKS